MQVADAVDDGGDVRTEGRHIVGQRGAHLEAGGASGVAEAVEAPQHQHAKDDDRAEGSGKSQCGARRGFPLARRRFRSR